LHPDAYIAEIRANLPRLLSLIDGDPTSKSFGVADRYYWAWGLIDFGNATFQGMAHGMARLWKHGLWPYPTSQEKFLDRIDALFVGAASLTRSDGSLEEAFPNEGSYCVTALVAFDLLVTLDLLDEQISNQKRSQWRNVIQALVGYLVRADETHAVISNHLATAVAALVRWHRLTGDEAPALRARQLMDRILDHQSEEGWFCEYQGADPGYQSLCTYYLADVHQLRPDWNLHGPLQKSIRFLWHFAHPDGSFGGVYGSRYTRFYYPAGFLALAGEIPEAAVLANFMEQSIGRRSVVTLSSMDEPNLVPAFNAYCWAAAMSMQRYDSDPAANMALPSLVAEPFRVEYPKAGLLVDRGPEHYTIISTTKGGAVYHYVNGVATIINAGVVVKSRNGEFGSSHGSSRAEHDRSANVITIASEIVPMPKQLPKPWQFMLLRLMGLTVFRFPAFREWVKRRLVRLLITGGKSWPVGSRRTIKLGRDLEVQDHLSRHSGYEILHGISSFVPIHMASQGYWQLQDESPP
jgi:hypothetical protein